MSAANFSSVVAAVYDRRGVENKRSSIATRVLSASAVIDRRYNGMLSAT